MGIEQDLKLLNEFQLAISKAPINGQQRISLKRLCQCSRYVAKADEIKLIRCRDGKGKTWSRFGGLINCGNHWCCPKCTPMYLTQYAAVVDEVITRQHAAGQVGIMLTLTVPHNRTVKAEDVVLTLKRSKKLFNNFIQNWKQAVGCSGSITSTEVRYSEQHGWHFHQHILYFVSEKALTSDMFSSEREEWLLARWKTAVTSARGGNTVWTDNGGKSKGLFISRRDSGEVRPIENGNYITKEFVKDGRHKNRWSMSIWDIMEQAAAGDLRYIDLFVEFLDAVKTLARMRMSVGLLAGTDRETIKKNLREKLSIENGTIETSVVCSFRYDDWRELLECELRDGYPHRWQILDISDKGGNWMDIAAYCATNELPLPRQPTIVVTDAREIVDAFFMSTVLRDLILDSGGTAADVEGERKDITASLAAWQDKNSAVWAMTRFEEWLRQEMLEAEQQAMTRW